MSSEFIKSRKSAKPEVALLPSLAEIASEWDRNVEDRALELESANDHAYFNVIIPYIHDALNSFASEKSNILDVGCGLGYIAHFVHSLGYKIEGIDIAAEPIRYARKRFSQISFTKISVEDFSYLHPNSFDILIANQVLHNLFNLSQNLEAFSRLLIKGGKVIASIPDPVEWFKKREGIAHPLGKTEDGFIFKIPFRIRNGQMHKSPFTYFGRSIDYYNNLIRDAGFRVLTSEHPADANGKREEDIVFCIWEKI